jgi:phospholipid/cholesterol/gamma-HCH transport system permease protein
MDALASFVVSRIRDAWQLASVVGGVVFAGIRPSNWPGTVRNVLGRQIVSIGVYAVGLVSLIAFLAGFLVVVQTQVWLRRVSQSYLLGPILVTVLIRELAPLLTNFVVIGRGGTAIATELANMKLAGEVRSLEAQGVDPFIYLLVPRVVGMIVSTFCLTVIFVLVSLVSGYACSVALGVNSGGGRTFARSVAAAIAPADVFNLLSKALIPSLVSGAICCTEGLGVGLLGSDVANAGTRAFHRSVVALMITSAIVSVLTYL